MKVVNNYFDNLFLIFSMSSLLYKISENMKKYLSHFSKGDDFK